MKIKNIAWGESPSGNAGCNNGNYDVPVKVSFDTGATATVETCRCGNGCSGSYAANLLEVGQEFANMAEFYEFGYQDAGEEE